MSADDSVIIACNGCNHLHCIKYHPSTGMRFTVFHSTSSSIKIDISDEHNSYKNTEVYTLLKSLNTEGSNYATHVYTHSPHLAICYLDVWQIEKISKLDYDWKAHTEYIVKSVMLFTQKRFLKSILFALDTYLGINYTEACRLRVADINFGTFLPKVEMLVELGFTFEQEYCTRSDYYHIFLFSNDVIQILLDSGFDLEKSIESNPRSLTTLTLEDLDKLLEFYPKPEIVMKFILEASSDLPFYKHLSLNYGLDMTSIVQSCGK
jgi:hypothetical protein